MQVAGDDGAAGVSAYSTAFPCSVRATRPCAALLRHARAGRARLLVAGFDPEGPGMMAPPLAERIAPEREHRVVLEGLPHDRTGRLARLPQRVREPR